MMVSITSAILLFGISEASGTSEFIAMMIDDDGNVGIGTKGLVYDKFGVLAIAAIQKQQQQIEHLKEILCTDRPEIDFCENLRHE